jgi:hypothetical protein
VHIVDDVRNVNDDFFSDKLGPLLLSGVPVINVTFTIEAEASSGTTIGSVKLPPERISTLIQEWLGNGSYQANVGRDGGNVFTEISYILIRGNHMNQFGIDHIDGTIFLSRPLTSCSVYQLQIAVVLNHLASPPSSETNDQHTGSRSTQQFLGATVHATVHLTSSVQKTRFQAFKQLDPVKITMRQDVPVGSRIFSASSILSPVAFRVTFPSGPRHHAIISQRCSDREGTETDCQIINIESVTGHVVLHTQPKACRVVFASICVVVERKSSNEEEISGGNGL